jgi:hypothetical protein
MQFPFRPKSVSTVGFVPNTTSAAIQVADTGSTGIQQTRVFNDTGNTVYVAFGADNTIVAAAPVPGTLAAGKYSAATPGSKAIPPGGVEVFSTNAIWFAALAAGSASATAGTSGMIMFTIGDGL